MTPDWLRWVVLTVVVCVASVWLIGQYRSRALDRPLSDTRDEWNTKR